MAASSTVIEDNKRLARSLLLDVWRDRKAELIPVLLHTDYERINPHHSSKGYDAFRRVLDFYWGAFSDLQYDIQRMVADEQHVAVTYSVRGTHTGSYLWIPPTRRSVEITCLDFFEVRDGKLARVWTLNDEVTLLRFFGLRILPGPALVLRALWNFLRGLGRSKSPKADNPTS